MVGHPNFMQTTQHINWLVHWATQDGFFIRYSYVYVDILV